MKPENRSLDSFFKAARQEPPSVPLEEMQQLIRQVPVSAKPQPTSAFLNPLTASVMVSSLIIAGLAGMYFVQQPDVSQQSVIVESTVPASTAADKPVTEEEKKESSTPGKKPKQKHQDLHRQEVNIIDPAKGSLKETNPSVREKVNISSKEQLKGYFQGGLNGESGSFVSSSHNLILTENGNIVPIDRNVPTSKLAPGQTTASIGATELVLLDRTSEGGKVELATMVTPQSGVELGNETLAKLGIESSLQGIKYQHHIKGGSWLNLVYENGAVTMGAKAINSEEPPTAVYPWFVTDAGGSELFRYWLPGEDERKSQPMYFSEVLDRLAPVVIRSSHAPKGVVVFWYEVTPEFLAALPKANAADVFCNYHEFLAPETKAFGQLHQPVAVKAPIPHKSAVPPKAPIQPVKPMPHLQPIPPVAPVPPTTAVPAVPPVPPTRPVAPARPATGVPSMAGTAANEAWPPCPKAESATSAMTAELSPLQLAPNPAHDQVTVAIKLPKATRLQIRLLDVSGRELKKLQSFEAAAAGAWQRTFDLQGLGAGLYVIEAGTDSQTWTRKLVVN